MQFWQDIIGELYTSARTSEIIRIKEKNLLRRIDREQSEKIQFLEVTTDGRSVSEAVNGKERSFDEFLKVLDKADRFREWTGQVR